MNKIVWFSFFCILLIKTGVAQPNTEILLYKNNPELNRIIESENKIFDQNGKITHYSNVSAPRLLIYMPKNPNGMGIIVCPGGGYKRLNVLNTEYIAKRLNKIGITVFVLVHRLPVDKNVNQDREFVALQDVQTAINMVRFNAGGWNLNPTQIGLWGSSAGGHLAATATVHHSTSFSKETEGANLCPDFLILAWPVISFRDEIVHKGSMINLLGENPTQKQIFYFSAEEWVDHSTPPTFLVHASDDTTVPAENSIRFYKALVKNNISAELHIYEKGGHGFGIAPDAGTTWFSELEKWLKNRRN